MRCFLVVTVFLALIVALPVLGVTLDSPFMPQHATANLSVTAPPSIPANGLVLGWAGGSGQGFTGSVNWNFAPAKIQPTSIDALAMNNLKTYAVGWFIPAKTVTNLLGISPPAGSVWTVFLNAIGGGPCFGYDTSDKKIAWGAYYRAEVLAVNF
jgi:hypothetical protein